MPAPEAEGLVQELLSLKDKTGWSWERMSHEFERVMSEHGPSNTTLFRYATGKVKRRNLIVERYVREATHRVTVELVEEELERSEEQRMRTERQLRDTTVRFRQLVENARDVVYVYRFFPTRGFEYVSPSVTDMVGYTPEEHCADPDLALKIVHPDDHERLASHFKGDGFRQRDTVRCLHKDGRLLWIEAVRVPIYDADGQIVAVEGIARDVTEQKMAEETLRKSESRYRSLYNHTPALLQSIDSEIRLMSVSDYWLETLGYERSEVVGKKATSFLTPDSREYAERVTLPQFFKKGHAKDVPLEFVKKNGETIDVLLSAISEKDAQGNVVRSLAVLVDVTEQKRAQEALLAVVKGTSWTVGEDFLRSLVRELATSLRVRSAFLSRLHSGAPKRVSLLAFWEGQDFGELFEYGIEGTPCEFVFKNDIAFYPGDVQRLFPEDHWLRENCIESYLAVPVYDPSGMPVGHLGVMHDAAMEDDLPRESILRIFAARAGAELERKRIDQQRSPLLSDSISQSDVR